MALDAQSVEVGLAPALPDISAVERLLKVAQALVELGKRGLDIVLTLLIGPPSVSILDLSAVEP